MEVLKIATAGSVDDGKSTLIGRLLYDTKSLTSDKLEAIEKKSNLLGYDYLDFSLVTDGLVAEREQGITIDVAHIYFSNSKKSYVIADSPGHVEYTRNMVTGASTSQASIILIDARKGIVEQTHRHFFINNLLRIKTIIVAVNKMDLVDYSEAYFKSIRKDFESFALKSDFKSQNIIFIPVSALRGDNIVNRSARMQWYKGPTLLTFLDDLNLSNQSDCNSLRFPVQYVVRPKTDEFHDFRGYTGKLYGGDLTVGEEITVFPSMLKSRIKEIYFYHDRIKKAKAGNSVLITLTDDINLCRGNMIVKSNDLPLVSKNITASVAWMDTDSLFNGSKLIIQHGVNKVFAKVERIHYKINTDYSGIEEQISEVKINDIARVTFKLNASIFYDSFKSQRDNGSFIIINNKTNNTSGVGFIE